MSSNDDPTTTNHHQWPDSDQTPSKSYALSGQIMLASIIILFVVVIFLVILHLYARWYLLRLRHHRHNHHRHNHHRPTIVFYVDNHPPPPPTTTGLNPTVLKSLPVFVFSPENDTCTPECAVCLSEFEPGETGRVLPKCKHSFHIECIDMWFYNNSTCPLCRTSVEAVDININKTTSFGQSVILEPGSSGSVNSPVGPGGMGASVQTTSYGDRMKRVINEVRIDVPNRVNEDLSEVVTSPGQGFRSPGSRLLTRIINLSRKSPAVSPSSSGGGGGGLPMVGGVELDVESAGHESSRV